MKPCRLCMMLLLGLQLSLSAATVNAYVVSTHDNTIALDASETRVLLNWAAYLSRYETVDALPTIVFVEHDQLVQQACFGRECQVLGWYNDSDIIYIDNRFVDSDTLFSRSLIVHELVHYLQHKSGEYSRSCLDVSAREAEAYWVQQEYHIANGTFGQIRRHYYHCDLAVATPAANTQTP